MLFRSSDLLPLVQKVISEHSSVVADYRSGKEAALMFLVGQGMKASKGAGNPATLREMLISEIERS